MVGFFSDLAVGDYNLLIIGDIYVITANVTMPQRVVFKGGKNLSTEAPNFQLRSLETHEEVLSV